MDSIDLSRIELIRQSSEEQLKEQTYLEDLTIRLGLNDEGMHEQPELARAASGGLRIWQYPNQFSKYLMLLGGLNISSYLEIGCRWGGTFVYTCEFLKKTTGLKKCVAVDIFDSPVKKYCEGQANAKFLNLNSTSSEFKDYMSREHFDIAFIDGNHEYHAVLSDFKTCMKNSNVLVLHDMASDACPGVKALWSHIKSLMDEQFEFHEFKEQYEEVTRRTGKNYLGIGVAIKKSFLNQDQKE